MEGTRSSLLIERPREEMKKIVGEKWGGKTKRNHKKMNMQEQMNRRQPQAFLLDVVYDIAFSQCNHATKKHENKPLMLRRRGPFCAGTSCEFAICCAPSFPGYLTVGHETGSRAHHLTCTCPYKSCHYQISTRLEEELSVRLTSCFRPCSFP